MVLALVASRVMPGSMTIIHRRLAKPAHVRGLMCRVILKERRCLYLDCRVVADSAAAACVPVGPAWVVTAGEARGTAGSVVAA